MSSRPFDDGTFTRETVMDCVRVGVKFYRMNGSWVPDKEAVEIKARHLAEAYEGVQVSETTRIVLTQEIQQWIERLRDAHDEEVLGGIPIMVTEQKFWPIEDEL